MRTLARFFLLCLLPAISACVALPSEGDAPGGESILTAFLEGGELTKTHFAGPEEGVYYPYWSGNELIAVYSDNSSDPSRFALKSGQNSRKATFAGPVSGRRYIALYPLENGGKHNEGSVSLTLPAVQNYKQGSFGEGAFPMLAVSSSNSLSFKNLCAVLKVSMTGRYSVQSITFIANDEGMAVSGQASVSTANPEAPALVMEGGGSPKVQLVVPEVKLSEQTATDFYIVVPPGTYKRGITLKIKTSEGTVTRSTDTDLVFKRSELRAIPAFECSGAQIDPTDLPDNTIWYKTENGQPVNISTYAFASPIVSNTYKDGRGELVFREGIKEIPEKAFDSQPVTEVIVPSSIEIIGKEAFAHSSLQSFKVPDNLKTVDRGAFAYCPNLSEFTGPHTFDHGNAIVLNDEIVAYIGNIGSKIVIPEGVYSIAATSFRLDDSVAPRLKELVFPEGLISIASDNFSGLPNLEYIYLPSTFSITWQGTFSHCPNLKQFRGPCPQIYDNGKLLVFNDGHVTDFAGAGITDYVMPEGVTAIESYVFSRKPALKSITFPSSLNSVFESAFVEVENLCYFYGKGASADAHSLVIDGSVVAVTPGIEEYTSPPEATAFNLWIDFPVKKITFNDNLKSICDFAFYSADALESLTLPASLLSLGYYCFGSMDNLKEIFFRGVDPPACGSSSGAIFPSGLTVYVPEESLEKYKREASLSFLAPYMKAYTPQNISSDPRDGKVTVLQKASEGNGIDIVVMGDAFSKYQFDNGSYDRLMQKITDAFFEVEPYKSYRHLFNVYQVNVVSLYDGYSSSSGSALKTWFGDGTQVGGDDGLCEAYAKKALPEDRIDNALIIIAMNSTQYAGTCYMYVTSSMPGDWSNGPAHAYFSLGASDEVLAQSVHHEAGGHGFAKLADEYTYDYNDTVPQSEIDDVRSLEKWGWYKNIDFTSDPSAVKWSHFLSDDRYKYDGLGVFEGARYYPRGVYRPTENSIMRYNTGGYNAPSREAIWYRIHKLAYGKDWTYRYEDFVSYDARNRKTSASSNAFAPGPLPIPLAPPVIKMAPAGDDTRR